MVARRNRRCQLELQSLQETLYKKAQDEYNRRMKVGEYAKKCFKEKALTLCDMEGPCPLKKTDKYICTSLDKYRKKLTRNAMKKVHRNKRTNGVQVRNVSTKNILEAGKLRQDLVPKLIGKYHIQYRCYR